VITAEVEAPRVEEQAAEDAAQQPPAKRSLAVALRLIRAYQVIRAGYPSPCRFIPSCSAYAVEAVERHGARRGGWLAFRRILRCHPFGGHGVDLVPLELGRKARKGQ
jgi:putative membrane protein insertion efficiency factor